MCMTPVWPQHERYVACTVDQTGGPNHFFSFSEFLLVQTPTCKFAVTYGHFDPSTSKYGIIAKSKISTIFAKIPFSVQFRCVLFATAFVHLRGPIRKSFWTRKYCCKFARIKNRKKLRSKIFNDGEGENSKSLLRDNELPFKILKILTIFAIIPYLR